MTEAELGIQGMQPVGTATETKPIQQAIEAKQTVEQDRRAINKALKGISGYIDPAMIRDALREGVDVADQANIKLAARSLEVLEGIGRESPEIMLLEQAIRRRYEEGLKTERMKGMGETEDGKKARERQEREELAKKLSLEEKLAQERKEARLKEIAEKEEALLSADLTDANVRTEVANYLLTSDPLKKVQDLVVEPKGLPDRARDFLAGHKRLGAIAKRLGIYPEEDAVDKLARIAVSRIKRGVDPEDARQLLGQWGDVFTRLLEGESDQEYQRFEEKVASQAVNYLAEQRNKRTDRLHVVVEGCNSSLAPKLLGELVRHDTKGVDLLILEADPKASQEIRETVAALEKAGILAELGMRVRVREADLFDDIYKKDTLKGTVDVLVSDHSINRLSENDAIRYARATSQLLRGKHFAVSYVPNDVLYTTLTGERRGVDVEASLDEFRRWSSLDGVVNNLYKEGIVSTRELGGVWLYRDNCDVYTKVDWESIARGMVNRAGGLTPKVLRRIQRMEERYGVDILSTMRGDLSGMIPRDSL